MKNFDLSNFEKIVLGICTIVSVFTLLGIYIYRNSIDTNLVYLVTVLVSAFVARKGLKYHYEYGQSKADMISDDSTENTSVNSKNLKK